MLTIVFSVGSAGVAAAVAVWAGKRRGMAEVETKADAELARLVEAQSRRLSLMDRENADLRARVSQLEADLAALKQSLDVERNTSARLELALHMAQQDAH